MTNQLLKLTRIKHLKKVLIANRGEIAVRCIQACHELGLKAVAVYSIADKQGLPVQLADEAVCIGAASPQASYLNISNLIEAAKMTGADAIHPGYGFLSETAAFAKACETNQIKFIGPSSKVIALMGDKEQARATMQKAGVPVVPGSSIAVTELSAALDQARQIGFPIMLKAVAGGGGKGMRVIQAESDLKEQFPLAQTEAKQSFNDQRMYLERYLAHPRHIEVQLVGDQQGHIKAIGERDCTIQQRHQKILEEAPAIALDESTRQEMFKVAENAGRQIGYQSLGTMEFLYVGPGQFYFMEMNTRVQVEHPVTELTSNLDLVQTQLLIADGQPFVFENQALAKLQAIECRITALSAGQVTGLYLPGGNGIRIDSALYQGVTVPPDYDAMIAKVIVTAPTRQQALQKMRVVIDEMVILGVQTNLNFLAQLLDEKDLIQNQTDINWLDHLVG